jgi:hypothetical protein
MLGLLYSFEWDSILQSLVGSHSSRQRRGTLKMQVAAMWHLGW